MFHYASAIFWFAAQPLNLSTLLVLAALVLCFVRLRRWAFAAGLAAFLVLALSTWTTLGALLLHPLEDRFARPADLPADVDGIVVLGGGLEGGINLVRGGYDLNASGDRFVETAVLARRFPDARILISGGRASLLLAGEGDAESGPRLLEALGVARSRMILEDRSRDTYENALFSRRLADPKPGETWLLVTSAFHMPRSVAVFQKAGFPVLPWPCDYKTAGDETFGLAADNPIDSLQNATTAIREWIATLAYWATGRTDALLPAPKAGN